LYNPRNTSLGTPASGTILHPQASNNMQAHPWSCESNHPGPNGKDISGHKRLIRTLSPSTISSTPTVRIPLVRESPLWTRTHTGCMACTVRPEILLLLLCPYVAGANLHQHGSSTLSSREEEPCNPPHSPFSRFTHTNTGPHGVVLVPPLAFIHSNHFLTPRLHPHIDSTTSHFTLKNVHPQACSSRTGPHVRILYVVVDICISMYIWVVLECLP